MSDKLTPLIVRNGQPHQGRVQPVLASATIDERGGTVFIGGGSATTVTLPDPVMDGIEYEFVTITAQAHVIDNSAGSGFNGAGAGSDIATFTAAIANNLRVKSYNGAWYVTNNVNATLA